MASVDLQRVHDDLVEVAKRAGDMITSATPSSAGLGSKKNSADLVTETDKAVEEMVSSTLRDKYPNFAFMGEETYQPGDRLTDQPTWVVDPIDGTTNFVHAYPYVSISLGLAIDRQPVVGVVFNPFTNVMYSAISGKGAYLNREVPLPLKARGQSGSSTYGTSTGAAAQRVLEPVTDLDQALVAIEWGSDRSGNDFDLKLQTFGKLAARKEDGGGMVHGLRSYGSAALNLCGVAEGSLDIYYEGGCFAWDVVAGMCILREAGGRIVDGNAGRWEVNVDDRRYLAVRNGVEDKVVEQFWKCTQGNLSYGP